MTNRFVIVPSCIPTTVPLKVPIERSGICIRVSYQSPTVCLELKARCITFGTDFVTFWVGDINRLAKIMPTELATLTVLRSYSCQLDAILRKVAVWEECTLDAVNL